MRVRGKAHEHYKILRLKLKLVTEPQAFGRPLKEMTHEVRVVAVGGFDDGLRRRVQDGYGKRLCESFAKQLPEICPSVLFAAALLRSGSTMNGIQSWDE